MNNKYILALLVSLFCLNLVKGQEIDSLQMKIDSIEASLVYKYGVIELESGNAKIKVPKGFRFLDKKQSNYVLSDLWGNPINNSIIGMLVPENLGVLADKAWVFSISFDEMGFVKDDDANDIDYDELSIEIKKELDESNPERVKQGYETVQFIGWASKPYYDKNKNILHWAKEIKFGNDSINTLNYNLRILGRKGIFVINAIASMSELPDVKANIKNVSSCIDFKEGNKYSDFIPDVDNVAAWTVGGLVAGKVLTKVGFFVILAKFWKIIILGVIAASSAVWKFITRKKEDEEEIVEDNVVVLDENIVNTNSQNEETTNTETK